MQFLYLYRRKKIVSSFSKFMRSDFVGADFLKILIFFLVRYFATNFGLFFFLLQDNYTFAQPGIQMKVNALRELIQRIDGEQVKVAPRLCGNHPQT